MRPDVYRLLCCLAGLAAWIAAGGCDDSDANVAAGVRLVFGHTGMGPGEFSYPRAAALSPDGRLYVVDKAARVQCFALDGQFVLDWRMPEWSAGKPTGLGIGPDGKVYAADTHYSRVMIFDAAGTCVGQFGTRGQGPGQFLLPTDVAVADDGCLFVSEYGGNDRISKFSPELRYLFSFGGPDAGEARLARPQTLRLVEDGTLWVTDACNHRLCHFGADGRFLGAFGRSGTGPGELRFPYGLDVLSDGTFVVAEYGNNRLQRFDRTGRSLGVWGKAGRRQGQLAYPWAVVAAPGDRLFVVDSGNNRIQVVSALASGVWR
jgi:DNA-binding beta-propeller fold protein YncE